MGFVDKFLNILGKIKYKLMRMVGKGMSDEEIDRRLKEMLSEGATEGKIHERTAMLHKKHIPDKLPYLFYIFIILTILLAIISIMLLLGKEEPLTIGLSIALFSLSCISLSIIFYYYGKIVEYKKIVLIANVIFVVTYLFFFKQYIEITTLIEHEVYGISKGDMFYLVPFFSFLSYIIAEFLSAKIFEKRPSKMKEEFTVFLASNNINLKNIQDVIENVIYHNINSVKNWISKYTYEAENKKMSIISLGNNLCLSMGVKEKYLSLLVFREEGTKISIDKLSTEVQNRINFILQNVVKFKKIGKVQDKNIEELIEEHKILLYHKYVSPSINFMSMMKTHKTWILTVLFVIGFILLLVLPEEHVLTTYIIRSLIVLAILLPFVLRKK